MNTPVLTIAAFEEGRIDAATFDHRAHVEIAWRYLRKFGLGEALFRFDAALQRLVTQLGSRDKYHQTMTWFYLVLIAERMRPDESWGSFHKRNTDLFDGNKTFARYYSPSRLQSAMARKQFLLPDRACA